jgi:hypothetical protein
MSPGPADQGNSKQQPSHPWRDGLISAAIYTAEAVSMGQGTPPHVIPTPTTPSGQPLITNEQREWADVKAKQDKDRAFQIENAIRPPEQVEQRDRDSRPER